MFMFIQCCVAVRAGIKDIAQSTLQAYLWTIQMVNLY